MKARESGHRLLLLLVLLVSPAAIAQQPAEKETSYLPVAVKERSQSIQDRMQGAKPEVMKRQMDLLQATLRPERSTRGGGDDVAR